MDIRRCCGAAMDALSELLASGLFVLALPQLSCEKN
jgi:hypothetical protein